MKTIARFLRLAARYSENPGALAIKRLGGTPETYWKLDHPWFHQLGLQTVLDVGCNEGQFALTARQLLPAAKIYSFEPIPECFVRSQKRFARDSRYQIFNYALGDKPAKQVFSVSEITGASSLLDMSALQASHFPQSVSLHKIPVEVETLDRIVAPLALNEPIFLKIDVQGFEKQVLSGAQVTLKRTKLVMLEASFEPFYEGQALFDDIYEHLRAEGFSFLDSFNMMHSPSKGQALQGDFIFIRRGHTQGTP